MYTNTRVVRPRVAASDPRWTAAAGGIPVAEVCLQPGAELCAAAAALCSFACVLVKNKKVPKKSGIRSRFERVILAQGPC